MNLFPAVDPIPIPAPVWLMKALSLVTLSLHFTAVMMLVGGLSLVAAFSFGKTPFHRDAAFVVARRLPVLTTFAVNLGVPPLLFAQVLYGRAIYSSSVLIGATWFSVILLVMLAYWLIYRAIHALESGKQAAWIALASLLVVVAVGRIYAMNMTLMLRPDVWQAMYAVSPSGFQDYHGDPTTTPRWLLIMVGGPMVGGLWVLLLTHLEQISDGVKRLIRPVAIMSALAALIQLAVGLWAVTAQPEYVKSGLNGSLLAFIGGILFLVGTLLSGVFALTQLTPRSKPILAYLGVVTAFLGTTGTVLVRDAIRDVSLGHFGFSVWSRTENTNWSVVVAFLLLFVIMLGILFWLLKVIASATKPRETAIL